VQRRGPFVPTDAIEPFRPPSKLRALQALDDQPEPLHLDTRRSKLRVIIGHLRGKLAHQPVHQHRQAARQGRDSRTESKLIGGKHPRAIAIMSQSVTESALSQRRQVAIGAPAPAQCFGHFAVLLHGCVHFVMFPECIPVATLDRAIVPKWGGECQESSRAKRQFGTTPS
jgi:hypothetical protein